MPKKHKVRMAEKLAKQQKREADARAAAQRNGHAVGAHYAPGGGLSLVEPGHPGCAIDALELPKFRTPAPGNTVALRPVPGMLAPVEQPRPKKPGDDIRSAGKAVGNWSWRNRHNLTPLAASGGVIATAGAADPLFAAAGLVVVGGAAVFGPETVAGRTWWSQRERKVALAWAAGAGAWSLGVATPLLAVNPAGVGILAALTGVQSCFWWASRRVRKNKEEAPMGDDLSPKAIQIAAAWSGTVGGEKGPKQLQGSRVIESTLREPNAGTIAFDVELGGDVHNEDAVGVELRKALERKMDLPGNTVSIVPDPTTSAQIKVTIIHDAEIVARNAAWEGPVLHDTPAGSLVPFSVTPDGQDIEIAFTNEKGVEHFTIFGVTGTGKSNSLATMVLSPVMSHRATLIYVDGGNGTSAPHLAGAADWWAVSGPEEWIAAIQSVYMTMKARKDRRGKQGLGSWNGLQETDPAIILVIDEATTVNDAVGKQVSAWVMEMLREGRKLGVAVGQVAQNPTGEDQVGGYKAREQMMGNGSMIGHRVGSVTSNTLAGSSAAETVDLRALPPEPGWAAVIRRGKVLTAKSRVLYADEDTVKEKLLNFTPRPLTGNDAVAAGPAYAARRRGPIAAAILRGETVADDIVIPEVEMPESLKLTPSAETPGEKMTRALNSAQQAAQNGAALRRSEVIRFLVDHEAGCTHKEISEELGIPGSSLSRILAKLEKAGDAQKTEDGRWQVIIAEEEAA